MSWAKAEGAAQTPPWPGGAHPGRFWGSWITGPDDAPKGQGLRLQSLTDPRSTPLVHSLTGVTRSGALVFKASLSPSTKEVKGTYLGPAIQTVLPQTSPSCRRQGGPQALYRESERVN